MAISTYKVFLMHKASGGTSYSKLLDIKDYPDLGGAPESLKTTTLSDKAETSVPGVQKTDVLAFTANYTPADYATVDALKDVEQDFAVWFGGTETAGVLTPTGSDGKFEFKGIPSVYLTGGGVNEVVGMTISIAPSTAVVKAAS